MATGSDPTSLRIRDARADEWSWADERYRALAFKATAVEDVQLVAELDGAPVGLGRLVRLGPSAVELSGIWTDDAARGRGVARAMVAALIERARGERELWCVPLTHLVDFYASFGFAEVPRPWPAAVTAKVDACIALGQAVRGAMRR